MIEFDGDAIRSWRKQKGLSRQEIGKVCGVSAATVHNWEAGRNRPHGKAAETLRLMISGETAIIPLTPLEERLLNELQARRGLATREDLIKSLLLEELARKPG